MKIKNKTLLFGVFCVLSINMLNAQVTIGSNHAPRKGALLDLQEEADGMSRRGLNLPRVNLLKLSLADGEEDLSITIDQAIGEWDKDNHIGLLVYNTSKIETATNRICPGIHVWDGNTWQPLVPYPDVKEQKILTQTVRDFQFLDPDTDIGWPEDKLADRRAGRYALGHTDTNNTPNLVDIRGTESISYPTARYYIGNRTLNRTYEIQRSYSCDDNAAPGWVIEEIVTETNKNFIDGVWMTENLKTKLMPDGTSIAKDVENNNSDTSPRYFPPNSNENLISSYGALYNWPAAVNMGTKLGQTPHPDDADYGGGAKEDIYLQGICPSGWHLPSDQEWTDLENGIILKTSLFSSTPDIGTTLDYNTIGARGTNHGKAMKSPTKVTGVTYALVGTSKSSTLGGFNVYLTGTASGGTSSHYGYSGYYWSASSYGRIQGYENMKAWGRYLYGDEYGAAPYVMRQHSVYYMLQLVRCAKDPN